MHRKFRFSSWGLNPQLFLFFVLPLTLLLILVTFGSLIIHRRAMRNLVGERDIRAVRAAASAIYEQLDHRRIAVRTLAMLAVSQGSDDVYSSADKSNLEGVLVRSEFLLPFFDKGLAFFTQNGEVLAETGRTDFWQRLASLQEFEQLLTPTDQASIITTSDPYTGNFLILVSYATPPGPYAVGALSPDGLIGRTLVDVVHPSEGSVAFVVNADGRLIYSTGEPLEPDIQASHPGITQALNGNSGATYLPVDGGEHIVAYSPISLVGWGLVVEEPWEIVTSPLLNLTEQAPLVLIPVVVLSMIALWFATQGIVQPLKSLAARAARLAWGDFSAVEEPVGGIREIRHLQGELVHMAQKLRAAQQGLRNYISAMTHGQEEERRRLARELHDDTIQALIGLKQRVQLAELSPNSSAKAQDLKEIEGLTDQTIQNLRRVTRALRPIYLEDLGLVPALEMLAKEVEGTGAVQVRFQRIGPEKRLSSTTELALYRMAQEALTNVVHHSGANEAKLHIQYTASEVRLQVSDNGKGFIVPESPAEFAPGGHYGLLGLYERAEMIGARLEIGSKANEGTTITIILTVKEGD